MDWRKTCAVVMVLGATLSLNPAPAFADTQVQAQNRGASEEDIRRSGWGFHPGQHKGEGVLWITHVSSDGADVRIWGCSVKKFHDQENWPFISCRGETDVIKLQDSFDDRD